MELKPMKNSVNISLEQILQRKLNYYCSDENQELSSLNSGYIRGFKEMISDISLSEAAFSRKYLGILQDIKNVTI